ncbi:Potassium channel like [Forsythia ovata]|uniref:Potassium channel like n=1 Tax=Forsythia ovata TaxID=205694 RepID=A0ABD1U7P9_9LAMI
MAAKKKGSSRAKSQPEFSIFFIDSDWVSEHARQVTLFSIHCAGCFYYLLAAHYHDPKKTWTGAAMGDFLQQSLLVSKLGYGCTELSGTTISLFVRRKELQ